MALTTNPTTSVRKKIVSSTPTASHKAPATTLSSREMRVIVAENVF
jgi:hypothetical protein